MNLLFCLQYIVFVLRILGKIWKHKLNMQKNKVMASGPITSWQIDGETVKTVADFTFLASKITTDGDCSLLERKVMINLLLLLLSRFSHVQFCATP